MGYVTVDEARPWFDLASGIEAARSWGAEGERYLRSKPLADPKEVLRGRLEALGPPMVSDDRCSGDRKAKASCWWSFRRRAGWCSRRLLARIHRTRSMGLRKGDRPCVFSATPASPLPPYVVVCCVYLRSPSPRASHRATLRAPRLGGPHSRPRSSWLVCSVVLRVSCGSVRAVSHAASYPPALLGVLFARGVPPVRFVMTWRLQAAMARMSSRCR